MIPSFNKSVMMGLADTAVQAMNEHSTTSQPLTDRDFLISDNHTKQIAPFYAKTWWWNNLELIINLNILSKSDHPSFKYNLWRQLG